MFSKSANPFVLRHKSTIRALFKAKFVDSKTYSPLSNGAARIITNSDYTTITWPWLGYTWKKTYLKQQAITLYKVVNDHFPLRLHELFQTTSQVHAITWGTRLIISFFPDHSLRPENVPCTIDLSATWNSLSATSKPSGLLLLALKNLCLHSSCFLLQSSWSFYLGFNSFLSYDKL